MPVTAMQRSTASPVLADEITRLSQQLQDLSGLCRRLHVENQSLREHTRSLLEERARLVEKNDTARAKVEQMIVRLKALESSA